MSVKPPCKKRFLARTIQDLGEFCRAYGLPAPEGAGDSLKSLEQRPLPWFAQVLHATGRTIHSRGLQSRSEPYRASPWSSAMMVVHEPSYVGQMVFINVPPARAPGGAMDCVGLLVAIDRERTSQRLYEGDGGPMRWSPRLHLQRLDGDVITWGNCTAHPLITHRTLSMSQKVFADVYGDAA